MNYFVKQLKGFCVTYLHNPYECSHCVKYEKSEDDDFKKTFYAFYPKESRAHQTSDADLMNVPLNKVLLKTERASKGANLLRPLQLKRSPLSSCKVSKKKKSSPCSTSTNFENTNKVKSVPKASKKTPSDKLDSIKKQTTKSADKSTGNKIPGKGTLKRKRWFMQRLQQRNENYEDDLFEDQKFGHFRNLLEDDSDTPESYNGMKTPVFPFSLSPRQTTPSPEYLDCYNYEQLSIVRKRGEEYQYHLKKKRKLCLSPSKSKKEETSQVVKEEKSESFDEQLLQVAKILQMTEEENDNEEDPYFSDLL